MDFRKLRETLPWREKLLGVADGVVPRSLDNVDGFSVAFVSVRGEMIGAGDVDAKFAAGEHAHALLYARALDQWGDERIHEFVAYAPANDPIAAPAEGESPANALTLYGALVMLSAVMVADGEKNAVGFMESVFRNCGAVAVDGPKRQGNGSVGKMGTPRRRQGGVGTKVKLQAEVASAVKKAAKDVVQQDLAASPDVTAEALAEAYSNVASVPVSVRSLAAMAATLANGGSPVGGGDDEQGEVQFSAAATEHTLAHMYSCGMGPIAHPFAYDVGLPAVFSAHAGTVQVVAPGRFGMCVRAPTLDHTGVCVRGLIFLQSLVAEYPFLRMFGNFYRPRVLQQLPEDGTVEGLMLLEAAGAGNDRRVVELLQTGEAHVHFANVDGRTALHVAVAGDHRSTIALLLRFGADPQAEDRWGNSPYSDARARRSRSAVAKDACEQMKAFATSAVSANLRRPSVPKAVLKSQLSAAVRANLKDPSARQKGSARRALGTDVDSSSQFSSVFAAKVVVLGESETGKSELISQLARKAGPESLTTFAHHMSTRHEGTSGDDAPVRSFTLGGVAYPGMDAPVDVMVNVWDDPLADVRLGTQQQVVSGGSSVVLVTFRHGDVASMRAAVFAVSSVRAGHAQTPILVVGTHADYVTAQEAADQLGEVRTKLKRETGGASIAFDSVSLAGNNQRGLVKVLAALRTAAAELASLRTSVAHANMPLEAALRARAEAQDNAPLLTYSDLSSCGFQCDLVSKEQYRTAMRALHGRGAIFYVAAPDVADDVAFVDVSALHNVLATFSRASSEGTRCMAVAQVYNTLQRAGLVESVLAPCVSALHMANVLFPVPGARKMLVPRFLWPVPPPRTFKRSARCLERSVFIDIRTTPGSYARFYGLAARVMAIPGVSVMAVWQSGVVVGLGRSRMRVDMTNAASEVSVFIALSEYSTQGTLGMMGLELVHFKYGGEADTQIRYECPLCRSSAEPSCFVPLGDVAAAIQQEKTVVPTPCGRGAPIVDLAPYEALAWLAPQRRVSGAALNRKKEVSAGLAATVYLGSVKGGVGALGGEVAIKVLTAPNSGAETPSVSSQSTMLRSFAIEASVHGRLEHANVVSMLGCSPDQTTLVLEYVKGGSLFDLLHTHKTQLEWPVRLRVALDVALAMAYLHAQQPAVLHRDLKSPNILLTRGADQLDAKSTEPLAKVLDFGSAHPICGMATGRLVDNPIWLAPEVIVGKPYSLASDVYSFGVVLHELFTMRQLFEGVDFFSVIEDKVVEGSRPHILSEHGVPRQCFDLLQRCWAGNEVLRPTFFQICEELTDLLQGLYNVEVPQAVCDRMQESPPAFDSLSNDRSDDGSTGGIRRSGSKGGSGIFGRAGPSESTFSEGSFEGSEDASDGGSTNRKPTPSKARKPGLGGRRGSTLSIDSSGQPSPTKTGRPSILNSGKSISKASLDTGTGSETSESSKADDDKKRKKKGESDKKKTEKKKVSKKVEEVPEEKKEEAEPPQEAPEEEKKKGEKKKKKKKKKETEELPMLKPRAVTAGAEEGKTLLQPKAVSKDGSSRLNSVLRTGAAVPASGSSGNLRVSSEAPRAAVGGGDQIVGGQKVGRRLFSHAGGAPSGGRLGSNSGPGYRLSSGGSGGSGGMRESTGEVEENPALSSVRQLRMMAEVSALLEVGSAGDVWIGCGDGTVGVFSAERGRMVSIPTRAHKDAVNALVVGPMGTMVLSLDRLALCGWNISTPNKRAWELSKGVGGSCMAVSDAVLWIGGAKGITQVTFKNNKPKVGKLHDLGEIVSSIIVRGDKLWAACTMSVAVLDAKTGASVQSIPMSVGISSFAHLSTQLVVGCSDGTVRFWNLAQEKFVRQHKAHTAPVTNAVAVNKNTVLTASVDGSVAAWHGEDTPLLVRNYHTGGVYALLVVQLSSSLKGHTISAGGDGYVRVSKVL